MEARKTKVRVREDVKKSYIEFCHKGTEGNISHDSPTYMKA